MLLLLDQAGGSLVSGAALHVCMHVQPELYAAGLMCAGIPHASCLFGVVGAIKACMMTRIPCLLPCP